MTPSVAELLGFRTGPVCGGCGKVIPDGIAYYGFPLDPDNDDGYAWVNEWHDHCLGEWGWVRDDSDWGIRHRYCDEDVA